MEFVEVNERIRQELYHRDRQAEMKTTMNRAIVANSEAERRDAQSKSRSRSPDRHRRDDYNAAGSQRVPNHFPSGRKSSPLRRPSKERSYGRGDMQPNQMYQTTYVASGHAH